MGQGLLTLIWSYKIAVAAYLPLLQDGMDVRHAYPKRITLNLPHGQSLFAGYGRKA